MNETPRTQEVIDSGPIDSVTARSGLRAQATRHPVLAGGMALTILLLSSGCVVVGGYSSERGWFLWPGTIVIFLVCALLFFLLRRRR